MVRRMMRRNGSTGRATLSPMEYALARAKRDQCLAVVRLYRTLGGGWRPAGGALMHVSPVSTRGDVRHTGDGE
jgi:hypothetical protein